MRPLRLNADMPIRVFQFDQNKHDQQISNTIEAYIVNLDVSFLGGKKFRSKLLGRGRASTPRKLTSRVNISLKGI